MMTRLSSVFAALILFFGAAAFGEDAPRTQPDTDTLAAARELLDATGAAKQVDNMIETITQNVAAGAEKQGGVAGKRFSDEFEALMKKFATYKTEMLDDMVNLYAETFTASEMREVAKFYQSGTGAKFISAMPGLMQRGGEIGRKYAEKIVQDMSAGKK